MNRGRGRRGLSLDDETSIKNFPANEQGDLFGQGGAVQLQSLGARLEAVRAAGAVPTAAELASALVAGDKSDSEFWEALLKAAARRKRDREEEELLLDRWQYAPTAWRELDPLRRQLEDFAKRLGPDFGVVLDPEGAEEVAATLNRHKQIFRGEGGDTEFKPGEGSLSAVEWRRRGRNALRILDHAVEAALYAHKEISTSFDALSVPTADGSLDLFRSTDPKRESPVFFVAFLYTAYERSCAEHKGEPQPMLSFFIADFVIKIRLCSPRFRSDAEVIKELKRVAALSRETTFTGGWASAGLYAEVDEGLGLLHIAAPALREFAAANYRVLNAAHRSTSRRWLPAGLMLETEKDAGDRFKNDVASELMRICSSAREGTGGTRRAEVKVADLLRSLGVNLKEAKGRSFWRDFARLLVKSVGPNSHIANYWRGFTPGGDYETFADLVATNKGAQTAPTRGGRYRTRDYANFVLTFTHTGPASEEAQGVIYRREKETARKEAAKATKATRRKKKPTEAKQ